MLEKGTPTTYIHCRVTETMSAAIQKAAAEQAKSSFSSIIRDALQEYLEAYGYLNPLN